MSTKKSSVPFFTSITILLICRSCQQQTPVHVRVGVHQLSAGGQDNRCPLGSRLATGQGPSCRRLVPLSAGWEEGWAEKIAQEEEMDVGKH